MNEPASPIHVGADGPVAAMLRSLDLAHTGEDAFRGFSVFKPNERVYGGQVLAQSMLAAGATLDDAELGERFIHSASGYFLRPGMLDTPVDFEVERLHDGRSFSTRRTHALQDGVPIFAMTCSFQLAQPGLSAQRTKADVPAPDQLRSNLDVFGESDHPAAKFLKFASEIEVRHVEQNVYVTPAPRSVEQHVWVRFREGLPSGLDQPTHRALLAYACDQVALEPVLRATGVCFLTPGLSLATIDHSMHWHRDLDITGWFLFQQRCISATGGRGLASADVFDEQGRQVASFRQEGMVRVPEEDAAFLP